MNIGLFGRLGDMIAREVELYVPSGGVTVAELRTLLSQRYPEAAEELLRPSLRACVGERMVAEGDLLTSEDAVDFFPPFSGG